MKIRSKLIIATVATSTILAISLLSFGVYWIGKSNKEKINEALRYQEILLSREFVNFTFEKAGDVQLISSEIGNYLGQNKSHSIENVLYKTREIYKKYQNLFYIDKNHIKQFDTNRIGLGEYSSYPFFDEVKNKKETIFEFYKDVKTNQEMLSFAHSINDKSGKFLGMVVANVSTQTLSNIVQVVVDSSIGKLKKDIEIIKSDGTILFSNYRNQKVDLNLASFAKIHSQDEKRKQLLDDGIQYLYIVKEKLNFGSGNPQYIYFVIKAQKQEVNKESDELYQVILGAFFLVTIILFFIGVVIAKSITRPIEEATLAIIKVGEGDLNELCNIKTANDEYGILVSHIKEMTIRLNNSLAEQTKKARMASLGEMAGGIAHEINNPLQLISAQAHILRRIAREPEIDSVKLEKGLTVISETVKRIALIIKGLKGLTRDGGQDPFIESSLDTIIENTFSICNEKLKKNGIFLRIIKAEGNIQLECRAVQISQVLLNLVNNACDTIMTEEEKWIKIECKKEQNTLSLKITNSGRKISTEIAQKLFTPFFTTKAEGMGTGLGLSIAMSIIHSHKGSIKVDLENANTCFVIQLPLHHENSQILPNPISA